MSWDFTDHVCRQCLGRLMFDAKANKHRCSNCGEESGGNHTHLCCCGAKSLSGADLGLRCVRNPEPTPCFPAEIMVTGLGGATVWKRKQPQGVSAKN